MHLAFSPYVAAFPIAAFCLWGLEQRRERRRIQTLSQSANEGTAGQDRLYSFQIENVALLQDELGQAGILGGVDRKAYLLRNRIFPCIVLALSVTCLYAVLGVRGDTSVVLSLVLFSLAYLYRQRDQVQRKAQYIRDLEFYLPLVMERVVMAVQSGLDIIPALKEAASFESDDLKKWGGMDPVSRLLELACRMSENGYSFSDSLDQVASATPCLALKHAFVHLGIAHREGGELFAPLKELSDATQAYFQESFEEEIAKMPVKATMPLVLTFMGLIICFITAPLIQVIATLTKATPH